MDDLVAKISHFYLPGAITVWCALFFALASLWGYAQSLQAQSQPDQGRGALIFARRGYAFFALSILLASAMLLLCLYRRDFRIEYVYQYSGLDLPMNYQLAAFWAGQKGSFLIWLLWGALLGLPLRRAAGRDEPTVMIVYILTTLGLLFILVRENPFVMLGQRPPDGAGLNPLLQDSWMVIHPPVMFIGYAATAIPFAFAIAAMWRGDTRNWAARAFPWTLGGFMVLGSAILMGGYWAYRTLGWGGYWGWDPVENASLIPWLIGIVLIHGLYLERTRKRFRRMNLVIACLLYMSVLYGTFLTRSGVLADFSVHSFVDLGISGWLVALMAFFAIVSVVLLAIRLPQVETEPNSDPMLSRGSLLVMAAIVVGLATLVVTIGTSAPLITRGGWLTENPGQVGPEFYNTVTSPLALLLALLLVLVPFVTWREKQLAELPRQLLPSFLAGLAAAGIAFASGVAEPVHLLHLTLAAWALAANAQKVISMVRTSGMKGVGGYLSHVGVGVMLIGVLASSAYDYSEKVTLPQGQAVTVDGGLQLTFTQFLPRQGHDREKMEVVVANANGETFKMYPKLFVNDRTQQLMVNPDIHKAWLRDLYISPIEYLPPENPNQRIPVEMAKGESVKIGGADIRFVDLEIDQSRDPMMQLASGQPVELGARLEITRDGQKQEVVTRYRFSSDGKVESPPTQMPVRGLVAMTGIDPRGGRIALEILGASAEARPARLSIDVTRKPLIFLVWAGLYVILAGGAFSILHRWRQARQVDEIDDKIAAATV